MAQLQQQQQQHNSNQLQQQLQQHALSGQQSQSSNHNLQPEKIMGTSIVTCDGGMSNSYHGNDQVYQFCTYLKVYSFRVPSVVFIYYESILVPSLCICNFKKP